MSHPESLGTGAFPHTTRTGRMEPLRKFARKVTTKSGWFGDYDFKWLFIPTLPFSVFGRKKAARRLPPFFALDDDLPLALALVCGLQHALAMLAGLITPPIIFANYIALAPSYQSYMISASLISCGLLSMVQMSHLRIPFTQLYLGTGIITCVGTSFATLPVAFSIFDSLYENGSCAMTTLADGTVTKAPCPDAYGALLGTGMLCSIFEILLSLVPPKTLKRLFPPQVTATVILLIGCSLIKSSGFPNFAGGSNDCAKLNTSGFFQLCPNIAAPKPLPWGAPQFIGLGFLSFSTIVVVEIFGSPFMRNASLIIGLIVGCIVAGAAGYISSSSIDSSPAITFLWVKTFKLSLYGPGILPMIAVYLVLALEAVGDITASSEASRLEVEGDKFNERVQGGILADGLAGFLAGCGTVTPLSIFAQNNSVIAITRCANRQAGFCCACFLMLFGILGKISGVFLSIPNSVLGGVTTFLFATVITSGVKVLCRLKWDRRDRFILAGSWAFGFGNLLVPTAFTYLFRGVEANSGLSGFLNAVMIVVSTPYLAGGLSAIFLNLILPYEEPDNGEGVRHDNANADVELGHTSMSVDNLCDSVKDEPTDHSEAGPSLTEVRQAE